MKKFVLFFVFTLIGSFSFAQSTCSCGNQGAGHGCSTNCQAGFAAVCSGYGGACSCECVEVKTPSPFGKIEIPNFNNEIKTCGLMNVNSIESLSGINFRDINLHDTQTSKNYSNFVRKIERTKNNG